MKRRAKNWHLRAAIPVLSVAIWLSLPLLPLPASGADVTLRRGSVFTSRALASSRLRHHGRLLANSQVHLWVVSLPVDEQRAVHDTLQRATSHHNDAKILHALPGANHAWLVHASAEVIQSILDEHGEHVEAAPLPPAMKLSPLVDQFVDAYKQPDAAKTNQLLEQLQFLQNTKALDGETYVTILASTAGVPAEQAQAIAAQVQASLRQLMGSGKSWPCMPHVVFQGRYIKAVVCPKDVGFVSSWLATKPEVTSVELLATTQLQDLHSATHIQSVRLPYAPSYPTPDVTSNGLRPFWEAGLDGKGQIVGVVDTGLDLDSCYLYDPKQNDYQNGTYTTDPPGYLGRTKIYRNNNTRKVSMYVQYTDALDSRTSSHGTHVTTSLLGSRYGYDPIKQPDYAVGVAPGAKVAFFDMGLTSKNGSGTEILQGLSTVYLPDMYNALRKADAFITCNTWLRTKSYEYTQNDCYEIDKLAWSDQDQLHVFAAGNDGDNNTRLATTGTVMMPGTCKNVLTIGATENYIFQGVIRTRINLTQDGKPVNCPPDEFIASRQRGILVFKVSVQASSFSSALTTSYEFDSGYWEFLMLPGFDSRVSVLGGKSLPVLYVSNACVPLDDVFAKAPANGTQFTVLVNGANCDVSIYTDNLISNPRVAGLFFLNEPKDIIRDPRCSGKAAAVLQYSYYNDQLLQNIQAPGVTVTVTWVPPKATDPEPFENVAYFSSYGSGRAFTQEKSYEMYARMKPDLVAPGYILAGGSDGKFSGQQDQCLSFVDAGTSMATPQAAGAATIVRQYFTDGFYPTGARNASNAFRPTGTLIKAVLIAGTRALTGISATDLTALKPPPSQYQGFGGLSLARSLPLASKPSGWGLQVVNSAALNHSDIYRMSFNVSAADAGKPVSVVMTYYDPPAFIGSAQSSVNNLDLFLRGPNNTAYFPNGRSTPDPVNNVEKIFIEEASAGEYQLQVSATYVFINAQPQRFSLVILRGQRGRPIRS